MSRVEADSLLSAVYGLSHVDSGALRSRLTCRGKTREMTQAGHLSLRTPALCAAHSEGGL